MKHIISTVCLFAALSFSQAALAENEVSKIFKALFSIEGSCQACIDADECYKIEKTCQRNCVVSLLSSDEKTEACKAECTSNWASCLTRAKGDCQDYCPPE